MKKIYTYILLSVVALAAIHTEASAQTDPTDAIKLTKTISPKKDAQGHIDPSQFILRLESYVTGSSVETVSEIVNPVDLVLVLDTSTSMDSSRDSYVDGTSKYTARNSQDYTYYGYGSNSYYYLFSVGDGADGQYHEVSRGGSNNSGYYLYFKAGNTTYYLSSGSANPTTTRPTNITNSRSTIWTGVLYTQSRKKRLEVLQEAVNAFIDTVKVKSYGPDGVAGGGDDIDHRIAIVTFNQREYYETGAQGRHSESDSNYGDNLLSVTSSQNIATLKTVVSELTTKNYTRQDRGILAANNILGAIPESRDTTSKVIVVFTDGAPYPGVDLKDGVGTKNDDANKAKIRNNGVTYSHVSKDTYGASVFTVTLGELDGDDAKFMEYMSSNYPDAVNFSNPGTKKSNDYNFVSKGGLGLSEIFAGIAKSSTQGGESYQLDHTATSVVDVVTDNFIIPAGVKDEDVELSVECYWVDDDGNEHWVLESDPAHGYRYSGDSTPSASINHNTNKLTVSGFDFTKADEWGEDGEIDVKGNWVGVRELADGTKLYWGKKIVIEFPIQVNPDYEGGYDMPSNDITSGIYTKDKDGKDVFVKAYPVPSTDFPSICIMKEGLNVGETALFDVTGPGVNYTISLTQKADSLGYKLPCFVVLKRLDGGEYTVTEKNWTWMYDVTPASKTISQKVVSAEYLSVNVESIFEHGSDLENNETVVGMQMEVSGTDRELGDYTGIFCVLKEKDGEYAVDDLKGSAISLLYYFTNKRNTEGKPARAEAYAHNVFKGGKTQGGTESGGYEEESYD